MSTFLEMQDEVLAHGFDATTYRTRVKAFLNQAGRVVTRRLRNRLEEASATITTTAGTATSSIPAGFVRSRSIKDNTDDYNLIFYEDVAVFDELGDTSTGKPTAYTIDGANIRFWPVPDAVYTLNHRYWAGWTALSSDSDTSTAIPSDYHHVLVHYALAEAFLAEDDAEMHKYYFDLAESEFRVMAVDLQDQPEAGPVQVRGMWQSAGQL